MHAHGSTPSAVTAGKSRPSLGDFLRARRDCLRPEDLGFPRGRRRAPGLRREEVAQLCGISPTWYTWIEQGRTTAISAETLSALAAALRLSRAERAYLFELGARTDLEPPPTGGSDPAQLSVLVRSIRSPAYILDRHWDAIAWNDEAAELFVDWLGDGAGASSPDRRSGAPAPERNLLRYVFLDERAPAFIVDWGDRARRLVAEYRADTASWRDDPVRMGFVYELCAASATFDAAWRSQQVLSREGGLRAYRHPKRGPCTYVQHALRVEQWPELKLSVSLPRDFAAAPP